MTSLKLFGATALLYLLVGCAGVQPYPVAVAHPSIANAQIRADACQDPKYPKESKDAHETGPVEIAFLISPQGKVLKSEVVYSSGFPRLDEAAARSLGSCDFVPGTRDGVPVEMWTKIKYTWKIYE